MGTNVLQLTNINKQFGTFHALTNVNLNIEKGKIYGFIGKNGAGKTTLMRVISGMSFPTSGSIELFGKTETKAICKEREKIGVLLEDRGVSPDFTAVQNLKMQMILKGIRDNARIKEVLEIVGLTNTGSKKLKEFSLGMRRRLTLAATLLSKPEFLILDEPTNHLDMNSIRWLENYLLNYKGAVIIVSHDRSHILRELYEVATDFIFIDSGVIMGEISKEQLNKKMESKFIIRSKETGKILNTFKEHGMGEKVTVSGDTITMSGNDTDEETLSSLLHESGAVLLEYTQTKETLESYFINLIGGRHDA